MEADGAGGVGTSRRERGKQARRRRIARAAAELFRAKGYDAVTTDEIAERADVAKGTVFRYAPTKAQLLLLIYEHDLEAAVEDAFASLDAEGAVVEELVRLFGRFFRLYEADPALARRFVRELMFLAPEDGRRMAAMTDRFVERLAAQIGAWAADGRVASDVEPVLAAQTTFALYYAVLVGWLTGRFSAEARDALLRRSFALHWRGLTPENEL